jgi:hypothetical protein
MTIQINLNDAQADLLFELLDIHERSSNNSKDRDLAYEIRRQIEDAQSVDALPIPKADALPIAEVLVWALDQIEEAVDAYEETDHFEHFAEGIPASQRFIERAAKGGGS